MFEEADIVALIEQRLENWQTWSEEIVKSINAVIDVNKKQNKRINAMRTRLNALEEQVASDTFRDNY